MIMKGDKKMVLSRLFQGNGDTLTIETELNTFLKEHSSSLDLIKICYQIIPVEDKVNSFFMKKTYRPASRLLLFYNQLDEENSVIENKQLKVKVLIASNAKQELSIADKINQFIKQITKTYSIYVEAIYFATCLAPNIFKKNVTEQIADRALLFYSFIEVEGESK